MKNALIFQGGWEGHEPKEISERFAGILRKNGYGVKITDTLDTLLDIDYLLSLDLIVPCWTMGEIPEKCRENVCLAVENGVGLAGCHGGMCDAFRNDTEWQFMTGGQWVSHPGGDSVKYKINIVKNSGEITDGIDDFDVVSEQYYLHVDPAVDVLATTTFEIKNEFYGTKTVIMPAVWTKYWGRGRVFYCSAGHTNSDFDNFPALSVITERGMLWAGNGKDYFNRGNRL